jgi:hypothetical protein
VDQIVGRLLREVCTGVTTEATVERFISSCSTEQLVRDTVDAAIYHGIVPLLAETLGHVSARGPLFDEALRICEYQTGQVLRLEALLGAAVTALSDAGIVSAVFKGPALAHCYYKNPAQRTYADIDLLISVDNLAQANQVLRSVGLQPNGGEFLKAANSGYGEVNYYGPKNTALDLHWHPMREPAVRKSFNWPTSDLLKRTTTAEVADIELSILDPEDMLIAVATHACYDGAYRLGWFVDVARIEQSGQVRWDVLAQRCRSAGVGLPVQVVLDRGRRALGYHPEGSWPLARGTWRSVSATLDAARPVEQTFGQAGRGGVVFRATRRTTASSLAALAGLAVAEVAQPVLTDPEHRWKRSRHERDREAPHSS